MSRNPKNYNLFRKYILANKRIRGFEGGVVKLKKAVLADFVEALHLLLRKYLPFDIHRFLK